MAIVGRLASLEAAVVALSKRVDANCPRSGIGISVNDIQGGGGKSINKNPDENQPPTKTLRQLQIYVKDQGTKTIGITAGQVAGLVEDGTDTWVVTGSGTIWAQVDVSSGMVFSNLSIFDNGSNPSPPLDGAHAFQLIGSYATNGSGVVSATPLVDGSQGLSVCFSDPVTANVIPTWALI